MADAEESLLDARNRLYSCISNTDEPVIVGIDEAGRGPAVGPLVYGVLVMPVNSQAKYKDSKMLTPAAREKCFATMTNYATLSIDPVFITTHMAGGTRTLNEISRTAVVRLLAEVQAHCRHVEHVYIDGLGNNAEYEAFLTARFPFRFTIKNKADSLFSVVGGASIAAKVTRDRAVAPLNCGSGYPSDPLTVAWLRTNCDPFWGLPPTVRHSWATVQRIFDENDTPSFSGPLSAFKVAPPSHKK